MTYLRRAGSASLAEGVRLEWMVADGRLGRRWRAVATSDGRVTHALLLEVDLDGHVARLELTTPAGLLTLHPEGDGSTLHGNAVSSTGVRHLTYPWGPGHAIAIAGRPIADAVTVHRLATTTGVGEGRDLRTVVIDPALGITETLCRFDRLDEGTWRLSGPDGARTLAIDARGIPSSFADGAEWPLELEGP